ncbi:MAG: glycosyltransferase [Sphingobacteriaceae bacterium]|nr:glycosyltransferase [Sphingobacteriaceae bacterium]
MKKNKVSFFVPSFFAGGVEKSFINLANNFVVNGYEVDFIVSRKIGEFQNDLNSRVQIIDLDVRRLRYTFYKIYLYIKKTDSKTLITGSNYCNFLAILANLAAFRRINLIITQHNYQDIESKNLGFRGSIAPFLIKYLYRYANTIVAVSQGVKTYLVDEMKIKQDKIKVIYNPVITEKFYKDIDSYKFTDVLSSEISDYIVFLGRLEKVKNCEATLSAFSLLREEKKARNLSLVIIGDGADRLYLEKFTKNNNLSNRVYFLGSLTNPLPILKNAKLLINTSLSESFGIVFIEALALNVPIVATKTKGAVELLDGSKCVRLVENEVNSIKEALLEMLDSSVNGLLCDSKLSEFDVETVRLKYTEII